MAKIEYLEDFPEDEQEDFDAACARHGRDRREFIVQSEVEYAGDGELKAIIGSVKVSYRNLIRTYPSGHGAELWVYPFERDLGSGAFPR